MKFSIDQEVLVRFPNLAVTIPVIKGFDNKNISEESKNSILKYLEEQEESLRSRFQNFDEFVKNPFVKSYFDLFFKFGANPRKVLPTHVALAKRILEGKSIPNINPLVNLYNAVSIKYITPFGGEDLSKLYGDFILTFAKGDEQWFGIGEKENKPPVKGDLIWKDEFDVSTKSLNWRQCDRTKLTEDSEDGWFIMDGFSDVNFENIQNAADEFIYLSKKWVGGESQILQLSKEKPEAILDYKTKELTKSDYAKLKQNAAKSSSVKIIKNMASYDSLANIFDGIEDKESFKYYLQKLISDELNSKFKANLKPVDINISYPQNEAFGDYATNAAMKLPSLLKVSAKEISDAIIEIKDENIEKIEFVNGFINFKLSAEYLQNKLQEINSKKENYKKLKSGKGKFWVFEHTSPNPNKALHLGHLRNNILSMSLGKIYENLGFTLSYDCMDNNRGIAIAKLMWGYLKYARKDDKTITDIKYWRSHESEWMTPEESGQRQDRFMDSLYVKGADDFKNNKESEANVRQMVIDWESDDEITWDLWKKVIQYAHDGQNMTLKRLGNRWDVLWHEHEHYKLGKELVSEGLKKEIFKKSQGAVVTNLEAYNLPDTVIIKKDGTALYLTQDVPLNRLKIEKHHPDRLFWVIGPEQSLQMKQLFALTEQFGISEIGKLHHIAYGYMSLKQDGQNVKMSSRLGNVLFIDDLIDEAKDKVLEVLKEKNFNAKEKDEMAEIIALGAIKYSILKVGRITDISFSFEESLNFEGNSGPYLQYTYAGANSILKDTKLDDFKFGDYSMNADEQEIVRKISKFKEVVFEAGRSLAPNYICTYLYELASKYNSFYKKHKVLSTVDEERDFRIALTLAVKTVIKSGLTLLGIEVLEKM